MNLTRAPQVGYILTIGVATRARRRGVAAALLQRVVAELTERGCRACYLHVITYNQAAQRFYLAQGFAQQAQLANFYLIRCWMQSCMSSNLSNLGVCPDLAHSL